MQLPAAIAWVQPFVPEVHVVLVGVPLAAAYVGAGAALAGWLRAERGVRAPYTRKVFHFLVISAAALVHLGWGLPGVVVFGTVTAAVVLYGVVRGDGFAFYEALARPSDAPRRTLFVLVPLVTTALGGILTNVLFASFAPVGYMVTGWGDAVGEPVGTRWGRHPYRVPSLAGVPATRTLEGSGAVFVVGTAAAALALVAMGFTPSRAAGAGLACGAAATLVEAASSHGLDNLTVQVASAAVAWALLG